MRSLIRTVVPCLLLLLIVAGTGCNAAPKTTEQRGADFNALESRAAISADRFRKTNWRAETYFANSAGYVAFPKVGKGGFIVGGGWGDGVLYVGGRPVGTASITQGTIGLQIGGQTFSEMIFFEDTAAVERFKSSRFALNATASAVIADQGGSAKAEYENGVAVFIADEKGLMAEAAVGGQKFRYMPRP